MTYSPDANPSATQARDLRHDAAEAIYDHPGRAKWGAIFAGAVYALGLYVLLSLIGLGLGFTILDPEEASPMNGALTTTTIWQVLSQLIALGIGGYAAGRLAGLLHPMGAMLHGAVVWALTTLAALWLAVSATTAIAGLAGSAMSTLSSALASATQSALPEDYDLPDLTVGSLDFESLPGDLRDALREAGLTPENFQAEAREAFRAVISQQEQQELRAAAADTAQDILANPGQIGGEADAFIDQVFGRGAILSEEDRAEALSVMQSRFGISEADAEDFLQYVESRAEALQAEAEDVVETVRTQTADAAEAAADALASTAWWAALASLAGLISAVGGAYFGRPARA